MQGPRSSTRRRSQENHASSGHRSKHGAGRLGYVPWTADEEAALERLVAAGTRVKAIATRLGRSVRSVEGALGQRGLSLREARRALESARERAAHDALLEPEHPIARALEWLAARGHEVEHVHPDHVRMDGAGAMPVTWAVREANRRGAAIPYPGCVAAEIEGSS